MLGFQGKMCPYINYADISLMLSSSRHCPQWFRYIACPTLEQTDGLDNPEIRTISICCESYWILKLYVHTRNALSL